MKTIVEVELSDEQLTRLADMIDGKHTKRTATRKEIKEYVPKVFQALLREPESRDLTKGNLTPTQGDDWFDEYLMETCNAVFGG